MEFEVGLSWAEDGAYGQAGMSWRWSSWWHVWSKFDNVPIVWSQYQSTVHQASSLLRCRRLFLHQVNLYQSTVHQASSLLRCRRLFLRQVNLYQSTVHQASNLLRCRRLFIPQVNLYQSTVHQMLSLLIHLVLSHQSPCLVKSIVLSSSPFFYPHKFTKTSFWNQLYKYLFLPFTYYHFIFSFYFLKLVIGAPPSSPNLQREQLLRSINRYLSTLLLFIYLFICEHMSNIGLLGPFIRTSSCTLLRLAQLSSQLYHNSTLLNH
jgi:hypothetical protein